MFKRMYLTAASAAMAALIACPSAASAAPTPASSSSSPTTSTHPAEGTPSAAQGTDPNTSDAQNDGDTSSDASITIDDNGAVVSSTGLTAAQIAQVQQSLTISASSRTASGITPVGANGVTQSSVRGTSIHHTWHWWGLHVWVNFTPAETNYLYYHAWTLAAVVSAVCGGVAVIDGWAGAACLISAGVQTGRILDGIDYAHDHSKGLRLDFNINWSGATWLGVGTA